MPQLDYFSVSKLQWVQHLICTFGARSLLRKSQGLTNWEGQDLRQELYSLLYYLWLLKT